MGEPLWFRSLLGTAVYSAGLTSEGPFFGHPDITSFPFSSDNGLNQDNTTGEAQHGFGVLAPRLSVSQPRFLPEASQESSSQQVISRDPYLRVSARTSVQQIRLKVPWNLEAPLETVLGHRLHSCRLVGQNLYINFPQEVSYITGPVRTCLISR